MSPLLRPALQALVSAQRLSLLHLGWRAHGALHRRPHRTDGAICHAGTVCEDLGRRAGALIYFAPDGSRLALLNKTAEPMFNTANTTSPVHPPRPADGADPSLPEYMAATPPMINMGGYNVQDPLNCAGKNRCKIWDPMAGGGWNVHTFVGSRSASVAATFDALGSSSSNFGSPDMNPWAGKYGRTSGMRGLAACLWTARDFSLITDPLCLPVPHVSWHPLMDAVFSVL